MSCRKPKRVRPARRSTHTARKEEKAQLLRELQLLQGQAEKLRWQQAARGPDTAARLLTNAIQQQAAQLAEMQAQLSAFGPTQVLSPISFPIHFGRERSQRVAALAETRTAHLEASRAFLSRRCGALDVRRPHAEDQRFEAANGDFCVVRLSIDQFEGARSVRQVFDILLYHYRHLEISISEKLGTIAVREDDDDDDELQEDSIHQNRLVVMVGDSNLLVETNTVVFSQFCEKSDGDYVGAGEGLITTDFVDEDALYPYRPHQRVRKDHNIILQLTSYTQQAPSETTGRDGREELVVVLTCWLHARVHRPAFRVPSATMHELREGLDKCCTSIPRLVRETLRTGVV